MARLLPVALALLALLAAPAAAQTGVVQSTTSVLLQDIGGPVPPGAALNLTVTVTYRQGLGAVPAGATRVTVEAVEVPEWATFTLAEDSFDMQYDPAAGDPLEPTPPEQRVQTIGVLAVAADAPAFRRGNLTLVARAEESGNVRPSQGTTQVFVIPGFNGTLRLDAPDAVTIRGGLPRDVEFSVTNLGNAEALVTFTLPVKPELARVVIPEPVTLRPNETVTRAVALRASWVEGGTGTLTIAATPSLEDRADLEVEPTTHEVLVTSIAAIPAAPPLALVAALLAVAVVARRR